MFWTHQQSCGQIAGAKNKKASHYSCKALILKWEQRDSNPRPSACKADALNQLSYAPFFFGCKDK